uniref:NADH-ubiquinone oxidoreductase chain 6 n=1 Tax=Polypedilum vanderplanki TaxID=319348 RepID=A0A0M4KF72_POLVA|nr:NADH dehydrogenase subunit 6 [Polypedilum vanderplanki]ALD88421.1 NADH dehydrogenase subunit 6 [Polypedilum vanderplanki]
MLHSIFLLTLLLFSLMFFFSKHPLSMGMMLMMQTILIVLFSGMLNKTFWFSYSLFLIFLGGMLILFMYMTSIASNEQFKFKINFFIITLLNIFIILMIFYFYFLSQKLMFFNKIHSMENLNIIFMKNLILENNLMLNKMYNFPMNLITILLINYLFLTLIVTVKITNIFEGPLRPKN